MFTQSGPLVIGQHWGLKQYCYTTAVDYRIMKSDNFTLWHWWFIPQQKIKFGNLLTVFLPFQQLWLNGRVTDLSNFSSSWRLAVFTYSSYTSQWQSFTIGRHKTYTTAIALSVPFCVQSQLMWHITSKKERESFQNCLGDTAYKCVMAHCVHDGRHITYNSFIKHTRCNIWLNPRYSVHVK